ncbi:DUF1295 domain-containing protein [Leptospira sp. 'Mane']|uniref:DUF1295 domain-containing protein n=1 Tax=Leptospira sp. 'Mane' TaxID=3387407 RepID=UPI00398B7CE6
MNSLTSPYITAVLFTFLFMSLMWFWGKSRNNYAVIDVGWGLVIAGIGSVFAILGNGTFYAKFVILVPVWIWAIRLSGFLYWTRIRTDHPEDKRYADFRKDYGNQVHRKFFTNVFLLQGFLALLLSGPFVVASDWQLDLFSVPSVLIFPILGWVLFFIGVFGESLADKQLHSFLSVQSNKGKLCDAGLWKYSRHPNYFFEWVIWLGIGIIPLASGISWAWISLFSPFVMFILLRFVSGVPFAEKYSLLSKGNIFQNYQKTTNAFFPWFPRKFQ